MILVTGGAGFIGSHVVRGLLAEGRPVRVFDNFSTGKRENLAGLAVDLRVGDVRDPQAVDAAVAGAEAVIHLAAAISVPQTVADPAGSHEVNVEGTFRMLHAARQAGVRRFLLASSAAVYGDEPSLPKTETSPTRPQSPYALHKLIGEQYLRLYAELYGMETLSLRYFNVFGPRQSPDSQYAAVIPKFVEAMSKDGRPTVFGDGGQTRDFVFVEDVVAANLAALAAPHLDGRVLNVAGGGAVSLLDLLATLEKIFQRQAAPVFAPSRAGDIRHSVAAIDAAAGFLGYRPRTTLLDGLSRTAEWLTAGG
jgi:UDP-glucose 4-epimerase